MALKIPPDLKKITSFIRRAEELDKDKTNGESRLVAYYCRQYAVHVGIPLADSKPSKDCLGAILNDLEKEKAAMNNFNRDESKYLCREFADKIFNKADQEDRAGSANKVTARTFYAAATFFEILQQFYADDDASPEREEEKNKTVYAKWKATEILKAIKEGRQPTPGGYGEDATEEAGADDEKVEENPPVVNLTSDDPPNDQKAEEKKDSENEEIPSAEDLPLPPSAPVAPPALPVAESPKVETVKDEEDEGDEEGTEVQLGPPTGPPPAYPGPPAEEPSAEVFVPEAPSVPPAVPTTMPPAMPPPPVDRPTIKPTFKPPEPPKQKPGFLGLGKMTTKPKKITKEAMEDALELARFAVAALEEKEVDLAATRLKQALESLGR
mmetsp:Transcript_21668/g.50015  ORF Transcript_21668/g.50015 Transcript_21668/m.50015 type:complete len:382 (-) Transcript_21668:71-1216(-)|eukprot:CAMPEP_0116830720 /NCGR_PEP_ID=MMETSP0418-20121206/4920_1 /TAXON_ID=1158023 /ORGANISM="Astrosyne radiata, Strain 13vi08-1A" /LENGTH=381 /DNA_ID=CAMNT_0004459855 /DNA_START=183 /DNA_END=1328 /DNA_ORIENTATION=+